MGYLKGWSFEMFPGMAFEDVLLRTEKWGSKTRVRRTLQDLRREERDTYLLEEEMMLADKVLEELEKKSAGVMEERKEEEDEI